MFHLHVVCLKLERGVQNTHKLSKFCFIQIFEPFSGALQIEISSEDIKTKDCSPSCSDRGIA